MSKKHNALNMLGLLVIASMLLSFASPVSVNAAPVDGSRQVKASYEPITANAVAADSFHVTTANLSSLSGPTRDTDLTWTDDGPVADFKGNIQIPRGNSSSAGFRTSDRPEADRPYINPDKKLFDDPSPSVEAVWQGLNQGVNRVIYGFGVLPPDTNGAASNTHYIQTINNSFAIWDLTQANPQGVYPKTVYGPQKISTLWKGTNDGVCDVWDDGDPIVLFDEEKGVWLISQFALPDYPYGPFFECIAVSQTDNPLGMWNLYRYSFDVMNDYPHFGIWNDGYYMSINQFDPSTSPAWRGQGAVVFERSKMSDADPAVAATARMIYVDTNDQCTDGTQLECFLGGMLPSDTDGQLAPAGTPNFFMQFDDDAWGYSADQLQIWTFATDWTAGTGTFSHLTDVAVNAFDSEVCTNYTRSCVPQPGTTSKLDAIADRLMYRLQFRNFDAGTPAAGEPAHYTLVVNHTVDANANPALNNGYAAVRWYELRSTDGGDTWNVRQQADFKPDTRSRWMGSAAMDAMGNIAIGYTVAGSTYYPNMGYAVHMYSDSLNTMRTEKIILPTTTAAGAQTSTAYRWGDYSMMDVAPDGCEFFFTSEYLRGTTGAEWYTAIGAFSNNSCWNSDAVAPETTLTGPVVSASATSGNVMMKFSFSADETASFECSVDSSAFASCTSPVTLDVAKTSAHTISVRAFDASSNYDQTPATYSWTSVTSAKKTSGAAEDGYVLESGRTTTTGGTINSAATTFRVGDETNNAQYRGVISFDTSSIPDGATVVGVELRIKQQGFVGVDPSTTHGSLFADIRQPYFGTSAGLQTADFQSPANMSAAATLTASGAWYTAELDPSAFGYVNKTGTTQFRIRYQTADDFDGVADYTKFFSGNDATSTNWPVLYVYYIP